MGSRADTTPVPDQELIRRCLESDEAAWDALVRRYSNLVYALVSRTGLSDDEAADTFQSVFTIVWRNLELLEERRAFAGWISTIARREAWRMARKHAREKAKTERMAVDPGGEALPSPSALADEELERAERAALVQHAVGRLDERCRRMLTMLFWESPTPAYEVVAERLDMPLGSLGPTRGRCLEKLRERLEEVTF